MSALRRRRVADREYEFDVVTSTGKAIARIEKIPHPGNGHFAMWAIAGRTGHFSTYRDLREFLERELGS